MSTRFIDGLSKFIGHSSAAREINYALESLTDGAKSLAIKNTVAGVGATLAEASILTAWALFHSESLGGWMNPEIAGGGDGTATGRAYRRRSRHRSAAADDDRATRQGPRRSMWMARRSTSGRAWPCPSRSRPAGAA